MPCARDRVRPPGRGGRHTNHPPRSGRMSAWQRLLTQPRPSRSGRSTAATAAPSRRSSTTCRRRPSTGSACTSRSSGWSTRRATASCPACGGSPTTRSPRCERSSTTFGTDEVAELGEIERVTVHDVKAVEYFLKKRLTAIAPADEDKGLAELIHFGCTSEDINNLSYALMVKGAVEQVWLPRAQALVAQVADAGPRAQGRAAARAHPRPAGDADDDGQGARRPRPPPRPPAAPHRGAGVPRQVQRRDRHVRRARARAARRRLARRVARLRRGPRPDVEPADDPDREPRLAGRALRRRRALQPDPAQPLHRRVDLHLDGLLRPGPRPGHRRVVARCRTRSTRSASRTPRPTSR